MTKIILADDDEDDRVILRHAIVTALEAEDITAEVECVSDGKELVQKVREGDYALSFTDRQMPYDGLRVVQDIRRTGSAIPLYMVASDPQQEAVEAGADGGIVKTYGTRFYEEVRKVIVKHLK